MFGGVPGNFPLILQAHLKFLSLHFFFKARFIGDISESAIITHKVHIKKKKIIFFNLFFYREKP
jgi:hypothetical protein